MTRLAPGILVAAPPLADPHFERAVVLLAAHSEEGAFGWVVNGKKLMSLGELLARADVETEAPVRSDAVVRVGGPVGKEQVWLLYPQADRFEGIEDQFDVGPTITACSSRRILQQVAEGQSPRSLLAVAGYAGWGPRQLEDEIRLGAWLPADVDVSVLFGGESTAVWLDAYERMGVSAIGFTSRVVGSA